MIEAALLFGIVFVGFSCIAYMEIRRDIRSIRADVSYLRSHVANLDGRLSEIESRYGGPSYSEMLTKAGVSTLG